MATGTCGCVLGTRKSNCIFTFLRTDSKYAFFITFFSYENSEYYSKLYVAFIYSFILQLEVLELLVQNGADLNAKNKHDETPAGKSH